MFVLMFRVDVTIPIENIVISKLIVLREKVGVNCVTSAVQNVVGKITPGYI